MTPLRAGASPWLAALAATSLLAGCTRDTTLPPPPGPGTVQGRVVFATPGSSRPVAAAGAKVTILSSSLGATADAEGRFVVEGINQDAGALLVQADLDGNGTVDRQRLLRLEDLGAGPGRDVALGDVAVLENARMRGVARRGDAPGAGGHGGIAVFVPEGPYLTVTGDDGTWLLDDLPEGRISITFFRDGYLPQLIDGVDLRSGEDFSVRAVTLAADLAGPGAGAPGTIGGTLSFDPPLLDASGAAVTATALGAAPRQATVGVAGDFRLAALPPGLYRVEASRAGYVTAILPNVLVSAGEDVTVSVLLADAGVTVTPPPPPTPTTCVEGVACTLPNPCTVGAVSCQSGSPVCVQVGNAYDGAACGLNAVCTAGACAPVCIGGAACRPANACHAGVVSCGAGGQACADTGAAFTDGTACGPDLVCQGGACLPCVSGAACLVAGGCTAGLTSCRTGAQVCESTGVALTDGTSCGPGQACQGGACGPCTAGLACTPAGAPCHVGATSCATGRPVCADLGQPVSDGASCGTGLVCRGGGCVPCDAGAACTPANPCHLGAVACGTGVATCVDTNVDRAPGTACAPGAVCDPAGLCAACDDGAACAPANPCHAGAISCATGVGVCGDTGAALADGTSCGVDQVCRAGACQPCAARTACTPPANPCHLGSTSCATGSPVCQDSGARLADGAVCGTDRVCFGGTCGPCAAGAACVPAASDPCHTYALACGTGQPICAVAGDVTDDTPCGGGNVCRAGACTAPGFGLQVAAGGDQHALPNQPLPARVTLRVVDVVGAPVAGVAVAVAPPPGAQAAPVVAGGLTAADGTVQFSLTLGRARGVQAFTASAPGAFAPLTVLAFADAPADGTVLPLVNAGHAAGATGLGGPAPAARVNGPYGVAVARDGTVYLSDSSNCLVKRVTPAGVIELVAGNGSCAGGGIGDGGKATLAAISVPRGLALDELDPAAPRLYLAEHNGGRVRVIDLSSGRPTSGNIFTVAGDGGSGVQPWGDGGPAVAAQLANPNNVAIGPERPVPAVYVADSNHSRIRRVDGVTGIITTVLPQVQSCSGPLGLWSLGTTGSAGAMAFDSKGGLFVSGSFCGGPLSNVTAGVVRRDPDGRLTLVAGSSTGGAASGTSARTVGFDSAPALALDAAALPGGALRENLFVSIASGNAVGRIDGATGEFTVVLGTPATSGTSGDFGPGTAALAAAPQGLAFAPGTRDLYLADSTAHGLRALAGVGAADASGASLSLAGPAAQAVFPLQLPPLPLSVRLQDGAGTPRTGYPIEYALDGAGLPGGWLSSAGATTQLSGAAAVSARPGLALGDYGVLAAFRDPHGDHVTGSPIAFTLSAVAPPADTAFTVVNDAHLSGFTGIPGPGIQARISSPYGLAVGADGTAYFTDVSNLRVLRVQPSGAISLLAGSGAAGLFGDGGPAVEAGINPWGLALDEAAGALYVSDVSNLRIRRIDLASGSIDTVYGDGTTATLGTPYRPYAAGGLVWVGDSANVVREVDATARTARVMLRQGATSAFQTSPLATSCLQSSSPIFWACTGSGTATGCKLAGGPDGRLYLSAAFCGTGFADPPGTSTMVPAPGIVRIEADGSLTRVAGASGHGLAAGTALGAAGFAAPPSIGFDADGNLYVATGAAAGLNVGYFAAATGLFVPLSGGSAVVQPGEYLPATSATFSLPHELAVGPGGHVWVTDQTSAIGASHSLRVVW